MSRKAYKRFGVILIISAVLQYVILGCIVSTLGSIVWLESVSSILMCILVTVGIIMVINARNEKSYKKSLIEEKDERNNLISLSACRVTLFVALISYMGVFIYMKNAGIINGLQLLIFDMPVLMLSRNGCIGRGSLTLIRRRCGFESRRPVYTGVAQ